MSTVANLWGRKPFFPPGSSVPAVVTPFSKLPKHKDSNADNIYLGVYFQHGAAYPAEQVVLLTAASELGRVS
ncbi:MAG: hypothetical protein F6J86_17340 [Symploca sp. SIO1B1]|nr:hypothetical protein [Symploca sp. SIO1B1]